MAKRTSDKLSELAAFILSMTDEELAKWIEDHPNEIRSLAGSVLSQDETKGDRSVQS